MAVKNYGIRDQWTNLDKLNNVDIKSVDGVIESVKINGEEAGGGGGDFKVIMQTINVPETVLTGVYIPDLQFYIAKAVITTANSDVANGVHYDEDNLYRSFWKIGNIVTPNEGYMGEIDNHQVGFSVEDGNIVAISDGETAFEVTIPNGTIIEIYRASEEVVDAFTTSEYLCNSLL